MNILFVTGKFAKDERHTTLGGMTGAVYKSAVGMQRRGNKVRILAAAEIDRRWWYQGIEVISVKTKDWQKESHVSGVVFCVLEREYRIEKTIRKLYEEDPIDVIQYTGWFGIGLLHFSKIPAVMRVSTYTKIQLVHNYGGMRRKWLETVEYMAAKRMNYVFAPSRIMADEIGKDIGRRTGVIETPFLREQIKWNDSLMKLKLKNKKFILFFGRMSVDKGILVIRDILYKVLKKYSDIYFVFAGISWQYNGKNIEEELTRASRPHQDRVLFLRWLTKEKLLPVIDRAEMVLMPSLSDNFPNSCAEAMELGKIVIGTDGSSLEQFICDGKNGFLSEVGNSESLYDCIEYVLNMSEEEKRKISANARKRIERLNLEHYSKRMEELYAAILNFD